MPEPALAPALAIGERLAERFVVRAFEGRGPLGERYLATDEEVEVEVELRVVHAALLPDAGSRRAFVERMQRARSLSHQNFLRVHGVFEDRAQAVLAVQHATGQHLSAWVDAAQVTPLAEARPILGKVASALAHAHQHGIALGDLRPSTVLLLAPGGAQAAVKVSSIGVALALPRELYLAVVAGGPEWNYLATELRAGAACDARADVYSLAALTVALLSGAPPPAAEMFAATALAAVADLGPVLARALDVDPARRFATVEAFLAALDRAAERVRRRDTPSLARVPSLPVPGLPAPGRLASAATSSESSRRVTRPPTGPLRTLDTSSSSSSSSQSRSDVTRQVDEEELRRLAGEVSDILETTRQVSIDEIEALKLRASLSGLVEPHDSAPDSGRLHLGSSAAERRASVGQSAFRDDDVSFDFDTRPAPGSPSSGDATRVETAPSGRRTREHSVREPLPSKPPRDGSGAHARPHADHAGELTAMALGEAPPLLDASASLEEEHFGELSADAHEPPRQEMFASEQDPFAAAIEAHASLADAPHDSPPDARGAALGVEPHGALYGDLHGDPASILDDDYADTRSLRAAPPHPSYQPSDLLERPLGRRPPSSSHSVLDDLDPRALGSPQAMSDETSSLRRPGPPPSPGAHDATVAPPAPPFAFPAPLPSDERTASARGRASLSRKTAPPARRPSLVTYALVAVVVLGLIAAFATMIIRRASRADLPGRDEPNTAAAAAAPTVARAIGATPLAAPAPTVAAAPSGAPVVTRLGGGDAPPIPSANTNTDGGDAPPAKLVDDIAPSEGVPAADASGCPAGMIRVRSLRPFCVDSHEYPGAGQLPRTGVARDQSERLCAARGTRLCTSKEWQAACRGTGGASYPYGASYQPEVCNTVERSVKVSGSLPACRSRVGAFDMSGNVAEWTADGSVHGGAAGEGNPAARCSHDTRAAAGPLVGFRCCADVK